MPTYQYACTAPGCGSRFELVQSFTDPNADECPTCGGAVRKVFSAVGVVFKGSGFYRNDSRKASGAKSSDSDKPAKKSDSAPAKTGAAAADAPSTNGSKSSSTSDSSSTKPAGTSAAAASA